MFSFIRFVLFPPEERQPGACLPAGVGNVSLAAEISATFTS